MKILFDANLSPTLVTRYWLLSIQAARMFAMWVLVVFFDPRLASAQADTDQIKGTELVAAANLRERDVKVEGTLFLSPNVGRVRAVVVVIRYGLGEQAIYRDPQWRRLSETLGIGLLHFRISSISSESTARVWNDARLGGADGLVLILQRLATESGHQELADVPLLF